jgi:hypothetical protein
MGADELFGGEGTIAGLAGVGGCMAEGHLIIFPFYDTPIAASATGRR